MRRHSHLKGHIFALIAVTIWGACIAASKVALVALKPTELMSIRIGVALIVATVLHPKPLGWLGWKNERLYILAAACGVTFFFYFQNTALLYTCSSNVAVFTALAPIITALFAPLLLKTERPRGFFYVGCAIALVGIICTVFNSTTTLNLNPLGDFLAFCVALIWGLYAIISKKISALGHKQIPSTRKMLFYALLMALPITFANGITAKPSEIFQPDVLIAILYLGVFGSMISYFFWSHAIHALGSVRASTYVYFEPVVTIIVAYLLLDESITPLALLGMALIISGLLLTERRSKKLPFDKTSNASLFTKQKK